MATKELLEQLVCINLDIRVFHGRRQLDLDDLKSVESWQVPPQGVGSLGSVRICDKKEIDHFLAVKRSAERLLERKTVRFLGGRATGENSVADLTAGLDEKREQFNALRTSFLNRYEDVITSWKDKNPQWAEAITKRYPAKAQVEKQLRFDYTPYYVRDAAVELGIEDHGQGLARVVRGLGSQLFQEIATLARETYEKSFVGRTSVTRRALRPIQAIYAKLDSLSFIDNRTGPVRRRILDALGVMPDKGEITGPYLDGLMGLLLLLSDPERTREFGQAALENNEAADVEVVKVLESHDLGARSTAPTSDAGMPVPGFW